jgi:hypothetical protein
LGVLGLRNITNGSFQRCSALASLTRPGLIVDLSQYELSRVFEARLRAKRCRRKLVISKFVAKALAVGTVEWSMLRMPTFDRFV